MKFLLSLCIGAVLSLPFFSQDAQAAPPWSFEPSSGTPEKLIWQTEPGRSYDLWESTDLKGWLRVDGFPKQAEGSLMEHAFAPHPGGRGFFRIEPVDGPPEDPPEGFALIPVGAFQMGDSCGEGHPRELLVHTVQVSAFYMGKYEVTKALWDGVRAWGGANGYTDLPAGGGKAADHPVHTINWYATVKWCNARSERDGLTPCYTVGGVVYRTGSSDAVACNWNANGYRLPTEAEWEKAARGGLGGKRYPWGDTGRSCVIPSAFPAASLPRRIRCGRSRRSVNLMVEPRPRVGPPAFGGGLGDAKHFGGFRDFHADEVAELHQLGLLRLQFGEAIQGIAQSEQLLIGPGAGDFNFIHIDVGGAGTTALRVLVARAADQDAAHRFGSRVEKVGAVLP